MAERGIILYFSTAPVDALSPSTFIAMIKTTSCKAALPFNLYYCYHFLEAENIERVWIGAKSKKIRLESSEQNFN
jgi:hypothetical protein